MTEDGGRGRPKKGGKHSLVRESVGPVEAEGADINMQDRRRLSGRANQEIV